MDLQPIDTTSIIVAYIQAKIKSQLCVFRVSNGEASASHIFVVFGASGDLAKKKIYPTLWSLFKEKLMPNDTQIVGYARSKISVDEIRQKCQPFLKVSLVFTLKKLLKM